MSFAINPSRSRVIFGTGTAGQLADEVVTLGAKRALGTNLRRTRAFLMSSSIITGLHKANTME